MDELKAKRKMKVLVLVEVALQDGVEIGHNTDFGGLVLEGHGGTQAFGTAYVAEAIESKLRGAFPKVKHPNELWYVKSVREATAP